MLHLVNSGLGRYMINPHLANCFLYPQKKLYFRQEVEGTRAGIVDLLIDDLDTPNNHKDDDIKKVQNYIAALEYGIERLNSLPLSLRLVREIHARLMEGVRGGNAAPGEFRRSQNWIGPAGSTLAGATYVPPPPSEMMDWQVVEMFLQKSGNFPELIQCAILHAQFEPYPAWMKRTHWPFADYFILNRTGETSQPLAVFIGTY